MMEKVGYMGIPGSFSEIAAEKLLEQANWTDKELVPLVCAKNILEELQKGTITYGVLGVKNSSAGPVSEFVETFSDITYEKLGEYVLPIHHCLFKTFHVMGYKSKYTIKFLIDQLQCSNRLRYQLWVQIHRNRILCLFTCSIRYQLHNNLYHQPDQRNPDQSHGNIEECVGIGNLP